MLMGLVKLWFGKWNISWSSDGKESVVLGTRVGCFLFCFLFAFLCWIIRTITSLLRPHLFYDLQFASRRCPGNVWYSLSNFNILSSKA